MTPFACRPYRLTPAGLAALRASARANRPWLASTDPRSAEGKSACRLNALRHGERSAATRAALREIRGLLWLARSEPSVT